MNIRMSKSVKSNAWFVRVDGNKEFLTQKLKELEVSPDTIDLLAVFHRGEKKENPHAHFVITTFTIVQKQSFAIRMKTLFDITNRNQYAIEVWDTQKDKGAVSYMFHEEDAPILVKKNFLEEDLVKAKTVCAEVQKVVARNKEKASVRLVERALEEPGLDTRLDILTWMLRQIKEGLAYHPGNYKLKQYVEEVEIRKSEDVGEYARNLERQLWRD